MANVIFKLCVLWLIISIKFIKSDDVTTSSDQDRMSYGNPCFGVDKTIHHNVNYLVTLDFVRRGVANPNRFCGGVMLSPKFGLTASSCVSGGSNYTVRFESQKYLWNTTRWDTFEVEQIFGLQDNVCVFKIRSLIPTHYKVNYIPLPQKTLPDVLENYCPLILVAATGPSKFSPPICANFIVKTKVDRNKAKYDCTQIVKPRNFSGNSKNYFCTDTYFGGAACKGDTGIGAVCLRTNELIGIVTWFQEADCTGFTLYSRLDRQLKEIKKVLEKSAGCKIIVQFYFALLIFLSIVINNIQN